MSFDTAQALSIQAARTIDVGRGNGSLASFQLPAGNFVAQEFGMVAVAPRPDTETGSFTGDFATDNVNARYRWAYYDGVTPVRYELAIKLFGGSAPHIYELITGPSGMTVGNNRTPEDHGVIKWTPTSAHNYLNPANVTVKVYGQDGNTLNLTFSIQTTSSTEKFIFVNADSGDDSGDGSIDDPFQTLNELMVAASTSVTYPNRIVYLRGSTENYTTVAHTDAWMPTEEDTIPARIGLDINNHPRSYVAFPDESVTIDFSDAQIITGNGDDFFFSGSSTNDLRILGSADNSAEAHNIWISDTAKRGHFQWINFVGFISRVNGNFTNSRPIFSPSGNYLDRQYWSCHAVKETERTSVSDNDGLLFCLFHMQYWADDYCSASRVGGPGVNFKDNCYNTSSRYMDIDCDSTFAFAFMGQNGSADNEICYSKIKGPLWFNLQAGPGVGKQIEYRNTVLATDNNYEQAIRAWGGDGLVGPFLSINSVLMSKGPEIVNSLVTTTGQECHTTNSGENPSIDDNTMTLKNAAGGTQYRDLYLYKRGAEIGQL